ncbi:hypothetical protein [Pelomonas sp. Root1237]|uniref:hypothetical protein n=1 Tax=Pelomonas sp. Root1237 TaxID=1736434 RepID=UPI0012F72547|nr:hypothetical protein [Pelomonas sp. Root1237]
MGAADTPAPTIDRIFRSLSAPLAVHPTWLALDRRPVEESLPIAETDSIEQAITRFETHRTESIMSLQTAFTATVLAFSAIAAQAAPQPTVKLERVVVTGKAVRAETQVTAQLPRRRLLHPLDGLHLPGRRRRGADGAAA